MLNPGNLLRKSSSVSCRYVCLAGCAVRQQKNPANTSVHSAVCSPATQPTGIRTETTTRACTLEPSNSGRNTPPASCRRWDRLGSSTSRRHAVPTSHLPLHPIIYLYLQLKIPKWYRFRPANHHLAALINVRTRDGFPPLIFLRPLIALMQLPTPPSSATPRAIDRRRTRHRSPRRRPRRCARRHDVSAVAALVVSLCLAEQGLGSPGGGTGSGYLEIDDAVDCPSPLFLLPGRISSRSSSHRQEPTAGGKEATQAACPPEPTR